jgi:hypothetical protein
MVKEIDGVPVREVPPDFYAYLPPVDESAQPKLLWWAWQPWKGYRPIYEGMVTPSGIQTATRGQP